METPKIFDSELRFCEILWSHEPVKSSELVRLCAEELGWKKSTTYTVIKKCIAKGAIERSTRRTPSSPRWCSGRTCSAPRAVPSWPTTFTAACRHF